jgi:hypothetical protein
MKSEFITTSNVNTLNLTLDTEKVLELAGDFKRFARKTAEGILDMARTVASAAKLERESEYVRFCELIGYERNGSTIKKLRQIGEKYDFLVANVEKLPSSWTTVYEIAKLTSEEIESHIDKGAIHANMRAEDLKVLLGKAKKITTQTSKNSVPNGTSDTAEMGFKVRLPKSPDQATINRLRVLLDELKSLKAEIQIGADLNAFLGS